MLNRVNFSAKKKFSFLPLGSFTELTLSVQLPADKLSGLIFDLPILPTGWDNFEALATGGVRTTNLSGQPISGLCDEVLAIEGEMTPAGSKDVQTESIAVHARILSNFFRTLRLGENEYQWKGEINVLTDQGGPVLTAKALLESPDFTLTHLRLGLIRCRRISFGPIPNPFPVRTGELSLRWHQSVLELSSRFLTSADLPPLEKIARKLSELNLTNELLDHLTKSD